MKILNSEGKPVLLNRFEQHHADMLQAEIDTKFGKNLSKLQNSLGYEVNMTSLTTIMKSVAEQKFFEIAPSSAMPVKVGEGAFSSNLLAYRSYAMGDDFSTGIVNTSANNARQAVVDAAVDSLSINVYNWVKSIGWSIFDIQLAAKSGNWDLITSKERARKKNWDLGIQKMAFLGLSGDANCLGYFNQSGVTVDAVTLTAPISSLDTTNLKAFVVALLNVYRANCFRTAWPTHFVIPESDYLGLVGQASADFPIKSTLELLTEAFRQATKNPKFEIVPCAYGDKAYSGQVYQQYALSNYDEDSMVLNIPVPYTNTLANSLDNFNFQNSGFGQFTGLLLKRPTELYYLRF